MQLSNLTVLQMSSRGKRTRSLTLALKMQNPPPKSPPLVIIGLSGFGGVGKDTVARVLKEHFSFQQVAFADKVRELALVVDCFFPELGETYSKLIDRMGYEKAKRLHPCVREFLIRIGHCGRTVLGSDVWINAALPIVGTDRHREMLEKGGLYVYSDVRYVNEAKRIREYGGQVWMIKRPGCGPVHESEAKSIAEIETEHVLNNTSVLPFFEQAVVQFYEERFPGHRE